MGAIQIGGQWYFLQPDGSRLGPFPNETEANVAGTGAAPSATSTPATTTTETTAGGTTSGGPAIYDPNNPIIGSAVPTAGGSLVYTGTSVTGEPQFKFVNSETQNPTVSIGGRLVDSVTGQVIADFSKPDSGLSQNTVYGEQQQNIRSGNTLAEQVRQYNESFGMEKAKFNAEFPEKQRQFNETLGFNREQLDVDRGKTLLNLGSRPDTLIRYLFALRGQQAPQGLGVPPALPGFENVAGVSSGAPVAATAAPPIAAPPALAPPPIAPTVNSLVNTPTGGQFQQIAKPADFDARVAAANAPAAGKTNPTLADDGNIVFIDPDRLRIAQERLRANNPGMGFAEGGVIPEPVVGIGLNSGQPYSFGEKEAEVVVPKSKVSKDIFESLMDGASEVNYSEDKQGKRQVKVKRAANSYAEGGTIGFDPKVFNPDQVRNTFGFPQIPHFTGGTSYVPSAQRLFQALPSERSLYSGYLRDEPGLQSEDVFEMARRLAPQVTGLQAGRFTN